MKQSPYLSLPIAPYFLLGCLWIGLLSCDREELEVREFPRLTTLPTVSIDDSSATFAGEITQVSKEDIVDHGFIWNRFQVNNLQNSPFLSLGITEGTGSFTATATGGMTEGVTYFVKAYVQTATYLVFSPALEFVSKGSSAPVIDDFSPKSGLPGDLITFTGKNFKGESNQQMTVLFNEVPASIDSFSLTEIVCIVPQALDESEAEIRITVDGKSAVKRERFVITESGIANFSPVSGTFDDPITLTGNNFRADKSQQIVRFDSIEAEILSASPNELVVAVPRSLQNPNPTISVSFGQVSDTFATPFTLLPPDIDNISTSSARVNETITLNGANLNPDLNYNLVKLGNIAGTILSSDPNRITLTIPDSLYTSRKFPIQVQTGGQIATSEDTFHLAGWIGWQGRGLTESTPYSTFERVKPIYLPASRYVYFLPIDGKKDFMQYDFNSHTMEQLPSIPTDVSQGFPLLNREKIYYTTRQDLRELWEYDIPNQNWNRMPPFPGELIQNTRSRVSGFILSGILHYVLDNQQIWTFSPTAQNWEQKNNLPFTKTFDIEGFSVDGRGYLLHGNEIWVYRHNTDTWENIDFTPGDIAFELGPYVINNNVYFGKNRFEWWGYDPATQTWTQTRDEQSASRIFSGGLTFQYQNLIYYISPAGNESLLYTLGFE